MESGDYVRNNITNKIGYTLYRWYDFELARRKMYGCKE